MTLYGDIAECPTCGTEINTARPTSKAPGKVTCPGCGEANLPYKWKWSFRPLPTVDPPTTPSKKGRSRSRDKDSAGLG